MGTATCLRKEKKLNNSVHSDLLIKMFRSTQKTIEDIFSICLVEVDVSCVWDKWIIIAVYLAYVYFYFFFYSIKKIMHKINSFICRKREIFS